MARIRSQLSYANVMATIAVFLALGGGAYASLSGKDKKKVRRIADQEIAAKAGGLSVASATNAANADKATKATNATNAVNAANAVNADTLDNLDSLDIGLGFVTGRLDNMAIVSGTNVGAPSGVSTAANAGTTALGNQDLTLSPNRSVVMRRLSVDLTQPVACGGLCGPSEAVTVRIDSFAPGSGSVSTSISCTIAVGASSCTAAGPSGVVAANSSLRATVLTTGDAQLGSTSTDALFSWEAAAS